MDFSGFLFVLIVSLWLLFKIERLKDRVAELEKESEEKEWKS